MRLPWVIHQIDVLDNNEMSDLDNLLLCDGRLIAHPAKIFEKIKQENLAYWCNRRGVYSLPTQEMISFIKEEIGSNKAIEIGAGAGILGRELGIPQTDSKLQENPDIRRAYQAMGQPVIHYPDDIEKLEALDAIKKYEPDIVVAAWVTQKGGPNIPQSNSWGVNESKILDWNKKYIFIGSETSHDQKKILARSHRRLKFPWIHSRTMNRQDNLIYIWDPKS